MEKDKDIINNSNEEVLVEPNINRKINLDGKGNANDGINLDESTAYKVKEDEPEESNVTQEINLDDLYDGAVNNTLLFDPVTNEEVILPKQKRNYLFIIVVLLVVVFLGLYYFINKTSFMSPKANVEPVTTTAPVTTSEVKTSGVYSCVYESKSDAEVQKINSLISFEKEKIKNINFTYSVISTGDVKSAVNEDLTKQYETFYTSNANLTGNEMSFLKDDNGFTFNAITDYDIIDFNLISMVEGQTVMYVKPNKDDTIELVKENYESKGFTCTLLNE